MSLPSSPAQTSLLRSIYDELDISADDLAFIEAHGTGTQVGDPAEANALSQVIGQARGTVLPIGSAKTNVGHLEPVSGLVGVLKSILALQNRLLPRSLHFETPDPNIDFAALNLSVASDPLPLSGRVSRQLAGINSFGFGGTNAHTVIGEVAPARTGEQGCRRCAAGRIRPQRGRASCACEPLRCASRTTGCCRQDGRGCRDPDPRPHDHRLVVLGDGDQARRARGFASGESDPAAVTGRSLAQRGGLAFAFSGNGAQWAGMGQQAYQSDKTFREAFEAVDRHFMAVSGWSLVTMLFSADLDQEIGRTEIAQPMLFTLQVAIVTALEKRGIVPDMVVGHSVGEWPRPGARACWTCRPRPGSFTSVPPSRRSSATSAPWQPCCCRKPTRAAIASSGLPDWRSPRSIHRAASPSPARPTASTPSPVMPGPTAGPCASWTSPIPSTARWWIQSRRPCATRSARSLIACQTQVLLLRPSGCGDRHAGRHLLVGQRAPARPLLAGG
ncbi:MAG: acyltransferase domain-containing protein [Alphaproteobacteria bacterium]|nr:acyltransferase domain-containing protein [Alphaproteobacteria bacterium]